MTDWFRFEPFDLFLILFSIVVSLRRHSPSAEAWFVCFVVHWSSTPMPESVTNNLLMIKTTVISCTVLWFALYQYPVVCIYWSHTIQNKPYQYLVVCIRLVTHYTNQTISVNAFTGRTSDQCSLSSYCNMTAFFFFFLVIYPHCPGAKLKMSRGVWISLLCTVSIQHGSSFVVLIVNSLI